MDACPEGCWWADAARTVCSACVPKLLEQRSRLALALKLLADQADYVDMQVLQGPGGRGYRLLRYVNEARDALEACERRGP